MGEMFIGKKVKPRNANIPENNSSFSQLFRGKGS
jgi:hypothetical protein